MAGYTALILFPLGLLVSYITFRYQNRIAFDFINIDMHVPDNNEEVKVAGGKRFNAERLRIKNFGIRNLENVELHLSLPTEPIAVKVKQPSSISSSVVKTEWAGETLKIAIPNLPANEQFEIDLFRVGWSYFDKVPLRGTGGKYKIVGRELYEAKRAMVKDMLWFVPIGMIAYTVGLLVNLETKAINNAPSQTVSKQVVKGDK